MGTLNPTHSLTLVNLFVYLFIYLFMHFEAENIEKHTATYKNITDMNITMQSF